MRSERKSIKYSSELIRNIRIIKDIAIKMHQKYYQEFY